MSVKSISQLKADIDLYIKTNGNKEITGAIDNGVRNDIVDNLFRLANRVFKQATTPAVSDLSIGDLWLEDVTNKMYIYNGATWDLFDIVSAAGGTYYQATAPTSPSESDLWYDTTVGYFKFYNGTTWLQAGIDNSLVVHLTGTESITGTKTFVAGPPRASSQPDIDSALTRKDYVDDADLWDSTTGITSLKTEENVRVVTLSTTKQSFVPTGTTQTVDLLLGSSIDLHISTASGDVTLTLSNPVDTATYMMKVYQGVSSKDVIFPVGTTTINGGGDTVLGIASATQIITFEYDSGNFTIIGTGAIS